MTDTKENSCIVKIDGIEILPEAFSISMTADSLFASALFEELPFVKGKRINGRYARGFGP